MTSAPSFDPFAYGENLIPLLTARLPRPKMLTLRSPAELVEMTFGDDDIILGDRLLAEGQSLVIAAAGGTGKSRLLLQLAASVVAGLGFVGLPTQGEEKRWLILQTENSNRRLQQDLLNILRWLDADDWAAFSEQVRIHTLESDHDGFLNLGSLENLALIEATIEECQPDIIAVDPLNEFAIGDLNKDCDMRETLSTLQQVCRRGNHKRALIVLHHAITGRAGAAKATGYDRASFGRNSKALHSWARGQINIAPANPQNNRQLVVSCGKTSNGREFSPFAVALSESGIYELDSSVDIAAWSADVAGTTKSAPIMPPERVAELCASPMEKAGLVHAIREDCGCGRASAYRYIKKAEVAKRLKCNPTSLHYTRQ